MTAPPSTVGLADLRASLHEWLEAHREDFVGARRGAEPQSLEGAVVPEVVLQRALWEAGFSRWGWPEHCGGKGGSAVLLSLIHI